MSRIGKLPITIPQGVDVQYDGLNVTITGKFGTLTRTLPNDIEIIVDQDCIKVKPTDIAQRNRSGLFRSLICNMVVGVSEQFTQELNLKGVGYRASIEDKLLILHLGYSHPIKFVIYKGIEAEILNNTTLLLRSTDLSLLGEFAAKIRSCRPPEPYKGKGILYKNEQIIRKVGKSGK